MGLRYLSRLSLSLSLSLSLYFFFFLESFFIRLPTTIYEKRPVTYIGSVQKLIIEFILKREE